ncbi:hypothetical protein RN001_001761 [Aquatica leii]|uniref:Uncharacterized protein n=1 Tax=Aquatica leii TaxID=1421715 RepID=A0AAN7PC75_9COLE|nr:hypothetical protein RN001_001761 [Aquatica leii]
MAICGPKLSLCGLILSVWGIIQLSLMGIFYYFRSVALFEDIPGLPEKVKSLEDFYMAADKGYTQNAYNCWIAAFLPQRHGSPQTSTYYPDESGPSTSAPVEQQCIEFAASENASGNGPPKTAEQWRNIWTEWKYNVKKKSREMHLHLTGTGGRAATEKKLSDMEERFLNLISKIHLGDNEISDMLGVNISRDEPVPKNNEPGIILNDIPMDANFHDYMLSFNENIHEVTLESVEITSELEPVICTTTSRAGISSSSNGSENPKSVKFPRTKPNPRYTSTILESACNLYAEGQEAVLDGKRDTNAATNNLADAIRELARTNILLC